MPRQLPVRLLILRLSLVLFFAVWVAEKFIRPEAAIAIAGDFYGMEWSTMTAYAVGGVQLLFLIAFAGGAYKVLSYGFFLLIHAGSVIASYEQLLNPYDSYNHLFHASIPVLAALLVLFLLRDHDRLLNLPLPGRRR